MSPCQYPISKVDTGAGASGQGGAAPGVDCGQAGFWAPALGPFANQANIAVVNRAFFHRVVCPRSMTITKIGFAVTTAAAADDQVDVGIYNAACTQLLGSSGAKNGYLNSTGAKQVPLAAGVALIQGVVYCAAISFGAFGGAAAILTHASANGFLPGLFGTQPPVGESMNQIPWFPLTAPVTPTTGPANNPILELMQ